MKSYLPSTHLKGVGEEVKFSSIPPQLISIRMGGNIIFVHVCIVRLPNSAFSYLEEKEFVFLLVCSCGENYLFLLV